MNIITMQYEYYYNAIWILLQCNMNIITKQYEYYYNAIWILLQYNIDIITMQYEYYYNAIWILLQCNMNIITMQYEYHYNAIWILLQYNMNIIAMQYEYYYNAIWILLQCNMNIISVIVATRIITNVTAAAINIIFAITDIIIRIKTNYSWGNLSPITSLKLKICNPTQSSFSSNRPISSFPPLCLPFPLKLPRFLCLTPFSFSFPFLNFFSSFFTFLFHLGQYCPFGKKPIDCPLYTYGSMLGSTSVNDCLPCPAGYWCNSTGISSLSSHKCPVGNFCYNGTVTPVPCPASTYR